jgi:general secretion pathway protein A
MSQRHHEALAHLMYGAGSRGGVVVLTGEIGAGKTTVCRCFLDQVPAGCDVAYIFNPKLTVAELLQAICEEFHIAVPLGTARGGVKDYIDALNRHLLNAHAEGRNSVLIIDEAQNLSIEVLEQLLLTNLETSERKLLQIVLIGQPELREILAQPALEQLAQRVIARYHLEALSAQETASYIQHRLSTAGLSSASPFQPHVMRHVHQLTQGVPRRINLLCDRALLGAYAQGATEVDRRTLDKAARELFDRPPQKQKRRYLVPGLVAGAVLVGAAVLATNDAFLDKLTATIVPAPTAHAASVPATAAASAPVAAMPANASVPAGTAKDAEYAEQGDSSLAGLDSESAALHELTKMWDMIVTQGEPCDTIEHTGLRCYRGDGGFAALRRLGRPAVLTLYDEDGKSFYAVIDGLADASAWLRAGAIKQKVSLVVLARYFRGEFVTLWRTPSDLDRSIALGDRGPAVDWIAEQLAKLNNTEAAGDGKPFDKKMQSQLREFQRVQGLSVDGVAGPVTLMQLNRVAGNDEPRLRNPDAAIPNVASAKE